MFFHTYIKNFFLAIFLYVSCLSFLSGHPIKLQQAFYYTFSQNKIDLRIDINFTGAPALVLRNYLTKEPGEESSFEKKKQLLKDSIISLFSLTSETLSFSLDNSQIIFEENPTNYQLKSSLEPRDYPCNLIYKASYKIANWPPYFNLNLIIKPFRFDTIPLMNLFKEAQAVLIFKLPLKNLKTNRGIIFSKTHNYHQIYNLIFTNESSSLKVEGSFLDKNQAGK